ncbi:MAG: hypothetical protein AAB388_02255 [Patescibacteria group bacterium]
MEHKDKKLKLDLDFLGEGAPKKSEKKGSHQPSHKSTVDESAMSDGAKWTLGAIALGVLIIIIAVSASSGDSNSTATTNTLPPPSNSESLNDIFDTSETDVEAETDTNSYVPVAERTQTTPVVQTPLEICQERNGYNATYDSATNSCGCTAGYSLGATSQQCVNFTVARDESCASQWPGTSFLKVDPADGKNICDCEVGSYWDSGRTACYSLSSFNQSCVNSYGTGAYSTTEDGKRVCDCGYGYDWDIERNSCVSTASINAICEKDVGRNSRYAGYVEDGKYICTAPY